MVIKQTEKSEFKVAGGIVSRGFTDDILISYLSRNPAVSLILEAIEDFTGIAIWISDQNVDAHERRIKRDYKDKIIQKILKLKNPLTMYQVLCFLFGLESLVMRRSIVLWIRILVKRQLLSLLGDNLSILK